MIDRALGLRQISMAGIPPEVQRLRDLHHERALRGRRWAVPFAPRMADSQEQQRHCHACGFSFTSCHHVSFVSMPAAETHRVIWPAAEFRPAWVAELPNATHHPASFAEPESLADFAAERCAHPSPGARPCRATGDPPRAEGWNSGGDALQPRRGPGHPNSRGPRRPRKVPTDWTALPTPDSARTCAIRACYVPVTVHPPPSPTKNIGKMPHLLKGARSVRIAGRGGRPRCWPEPLATPWERLRRRRPEHSTSGEFVAAEPLSEGVSRIETQARAPINRAGFDLRDGLLKVLSACGPPRIVL